jgi:hypothetical protein
MIFSMPLLRTLEFGMSAFTALLRTLLFGRSAYTAVSVAPRRTAELLLSGGRMSLGDQFSDSKGTRGKRFLFTYGRADIKPLQKIPNKEPANGAF